MPTTMKKQPKHVAPHGTLGCYDKGCRCLPCVGAERTRQREKAERGRMAHPSTRYVTKWVRRELPVDDDIRTYRKEKRRRAKRVTSVIDQARAEWERAMRAVTEVGKGGRRRQLSHIGGLGEAA